MDWWVADGWAAEGVRSAVEQPAGACSTLACLCEQLPSTSIHPVCPRLSPHPCMPNSYLPQACCTTATPRATMSRPRSTSQSWAPRMTCTSLSTASPRACSPWSTSPCSGVQARGCGVQCMWWLGMDGCDCALLCHLSVGVPSTISHSAHLLTLPALSSHISPKPTPPLPCSHPPCSLLCTLWTTCSSLMPPGSRSCCPTPSSRPKSLAEEHTAEAWRQSAVTASRRCCAAVGGSQPGQQHSSWINRCCSCFDALWCHARQAGRRQLRQKVVQERGAAPRECMAVCGHAHCVDQESELL